LEQGEEAMEGEDKADKEAMWRRKKRGTGSEAVVRRW